MGTYIYGVDVGGTNIKFGLFDFDNVSLIYQHEIKTPTDEHEKSIFKSIYDAISLINDQHKITLENVHAIGLAVPCPVKAGFIKTCANLKWNNVDIVGAMRELFPDHISIVVSNDANVAAYGENMSLTQPYKNAVFITLGTGVGGGIIIDGQILEGGSGLGGEIGHMHMFDDATDSCGCGSKGCLEQVCGTQGILNYAVELSHENQTSLNMQDLTVKSIFDAAKEGDFVSTQVVQKVSDYLAKSASILSVILDPEVFIIGGGISKAGKYLIDMIEIQFKKYARFTTHNIPFILAKTGNNAGIIGAAYIAKFTWGGIQIALAVIE